MVSPHPSTTQIVAEAARRERLERLAEAHRYPGATSIIWGRFRTGPVIRWFEFHARGLIAFASPRGQSQPAAEAPAPSPTDG